MKRLGILALLFGLLAVPALADTGTAPAGRTERQPLRLFPEGELFAAPLANVKEPRFHTTWLKLRLDSGNIDVGSVGFGESFGLLRWQGWRADQFWQFGISGAVQAQFNLDSPSMDLVNADYIIGFPLTVRSKDWSGRLRLYHQSSHLGDEYLLYPRSGVPQVERINLSFEALEAWLGWDWRGLRLFAGPSYILHSDTPLERASIQAGFDYTSPALTGAPAHLYLSAFANWWEEVDWDPSLSVQGGVMLASPYAGKRRFQIYGEFYRGHLPFGQFYRENTWFYGLGMGFGF